MASYNQLPPLVGPPPAVVVEAEAGHSTHHSIETLVVVLAAITLIGVVAGIIARLCGGRHMGGSGDHEGWMERKCRSCIEAGVVTDPPAPAPAPPVKVEPPVAAVTEEAKK